MPTVETAFPFILSARKMDLFQRIRFARSATRTGSIVGYKIPAEGTCKQSKAATC
jgi:hypothetical protein